MSFDSFLNTSLAKYQNPGRTKNEVEEIMAVFSDIRPKLEETRTAHNERKFLLLLDGTIPVQYQAKTYNIPVQIWINDLHPNQAPAVFVKPSTSMYIRQSTNVDVKGRVITPYIRYWNPTSTLMGLVMDMVKEFGMSPPLASFTTTDSRSEFIAQLQLSNYIDPVYTKRQAIAVMERCPDIRGSFQAQSFADGSSKQILSLEGTIPVIFRGSVYNIPLCIHLMEGHPHQAPIVFVKPTSVMILNDKNPYVDINGRVLTSYIRDWKHPNFDLMGLLQDLTVTFGSVSPLYNDQKTTPSSSGSQAMTGQYQLTSNNLGVYNNYLSGQWPVQSGNGPAQPRQGSAQSGQGLNQSELESVQSGQVPGRHAADDYSLGSAEDET